MVKTLARTAFNIGIGLLAFLAGATGLRWALPFPDVEGVAPKYYHYASHLEDYDVLFVGSSRFYHHIIPREFDAEVAAATGARLRSFNCSFDALWPPESYYFLRQVLALKPSRLKWVVIDAMQINPGREYVETPTQRQTYWHDWHHTLMALARLREADFPAKTPVGPLLRSHAVMFAQVFANLGRGVALVQPRLERVRAKGPKPPGWLDDEGYEAGPNRPLKAEERPQFERQVYLLKKNLTPNTPGPALTRAMREISDAVRAIGAEPIFVATPTLSMAENWGSIPGGAGLISLVDPSRYPELYDPEVHYDSWHLNEKGAHLFTRRLAEHFAHTLQAKRGAGGQSP